MAQTKTTAKSKASNKAKVSKKASTKTSTQQQHCFITWTDWRAFQPVQNEPKSKQEEITSSSYSHIEGWAPEAFANRYRRKSSYRGLPLSTKNLSILTSQRTNSWEHDFLSALLSTEMAPLQWDENDSRFSNRAEKPREVPVVPVMPYYAESSSSGSDLQDIVSGDEVNQTSASTPDFTFEKCLAEVEQIVCESITDLPNMFDLPDRLEQDVMSL